jgi:hypothetical protein
LLNVSEESNATELWDKLGTMYLLKSLVKKKFLQKIQKKLYFLRMNDGDSMIVHLNALNIVIFWLAYVDINTYKRQLYYVVILFAKFMG